MKKYILFIITLMISSSLYSETIIGVIGDSVAAGIPIGKSNSWITLLQNHFNKEDLEIKIVNGSGDCTSFSSYPGLKYMMSKGVNPDIFIIVLGINDCLKFYAWDIVTLNIQLAIDECKRNGIQVIVGKVDMSHYKDQSQHYKNFKEIYTTLEILNPDVIFFDYIYPNLMGNPDYHVGDSVHPNLKGQKIIKENIQNLLYAHFL